MTSEAWPPSSVLRRRRNEPRAFLYAFDLLELNGTDMRREPMRSQGELASILRKSRHGVRLNEHLEHPDGADSVPARLPDGLGGHCVQAARVALQIRPLAGLAEVQEPGGTCSEAGGGRGLGAVMTDQGNVSEDRSRLVRYAPLPSLDLIIREFAPKSYYLLAAVISNNDIEPSRIIATGSAPVGRTGTTLLIGSVRSYGTTTANSRPPPSNPTRRTAQQVQMDGRCRLGLSE